MKHYLPHPYTPRHHQRGITLLESLVALLISALGILGIVGVQMRTLVDTQTAVHRAQAIRLIEDLNERLRANPNGLATMIANQTAVFGTISEPDDDCSSTSCTATQLMMYDLWVWKQNTIATLPLGEAHIFPAPWDWDIGSTDPRQIGVRISWRENEVEGRKTDAMDATKVKQDDDSYVAGVEDDEDACPDGRTCHLQYIAVPIRCAADSNNKFYCP